MERKENYKLKFNLQYATSIILISKMKYTFEKNIYFSKKLKIV